MTYNLPISCVLMLMILLGCQEKPEKPQEEPIQPQVDLSGPYGAPAIRNLSQLREVTGAAAYQKLGFTGRGVTVAILDNGFQELEFALGQSLPDDLTIEPFPEGEMSDTSHGTKLAELVYSIATGSNQYSPSLPGPDLKLFVTSGPYANLAHAVERLIAMKRNYPRRNIICLYSQVWQYGGNLDGSGYINRLVQKAVDAGVIWINASGNLRSSVYVQDIELDEQGKVSLPNDGSVLKLKVREDGTRTKVVLAWNDFKDRYAEHTSSHDLNFSITNEDGEELGRAELVQDGVHRDPIDGFSNFPREQMVATLAKGEYSLKVWSPNDSFYDNAQLWFSAAGQGVSFESVTQNVVLAPAGLPGVLTIGGADIAYSNRRQATDELAKKPDVYAPSKIMLQDGATIEGTSTAAAVAAGVMAIYRQAYGLPRTNDLMRFSFFHRERN